ncbi:mitochondrial S-adenosylmethionine carrier protein-like isoform X3 [Dermacentor andersoni]|uniref:mitochondrial S-adenosylmethionine carrier protein-like isoform X3 n=1 Tax=Dermacentor andersoni TaxID=34620 RepID=UPI00241800B9|nr:S-adenosylmethionine mitochondrial carrier protein-like isoform X3 [Dermacentor andersoni]
MESVDSPSFFASLVAGAIAGTTVDVVLFPLDTLKTRLQSQQGFLKAGGFKKIYSGVASAALGSAPTSALFFCTYEGVKQFVGPVMPSLMTPLVHSIAAACGEVVRICFAVEAACTLRVPVEVVKQRTQANHDMSSWRTFKSVLHIEGVRGFYRGYFTTVAREIPFSFIQFPLWEFLKNMFANPDSSVTWQAAVCGAISGGIAGGLTTPLDVAKTRIILAEPYNPLPTLTPTSPLVGVLGVGGLHQPAGHGPPSGGISTGLSLAWNKVFSFFLVCSILGKHTAVSEFCVIELIILINSNT